jgi:hypothetical protein
MKTKVLLLLILSSLIAYSQQPFLQPLWVDDVCKFLDQNHPNPAPELLNITIKPFDPNFTFTKYNPRSVGYHSELIITEQVKPKLIGAKELEVFTPPYGDERSYKVAVGHFRFIFTGTQESFNLWITTYFDSKYSKDSKDVFETLQKVVSADDWKGINLYKSEGDSGYLVKGVVSEVGNFKDDKGKDVYILNDAHVSLNENKNPKVVNLPIYSSLREKGANGLYGGWLPFSKNYYVTTMDTLYFTKWRRKVSHVRYFFFNATTGKEYLSIVINMKEIGAHNNKVKSSSGEEILIDEEAIKRPIFPLKLKGGSVALKMFLPQTDRHPAGEYIVTPEFKN